MLFFPKLNCAILLLGRNMFLNLKVVLDGKFKQKVKEQKW